MKVEDRLHLPGVSEARAPQLLAGALVAEAALELFEFSSMEICPWALREGLILRRLDQLVLDGPLEPAPHVEARQTLSPSMAASTLPAGRQAAS
jgi:exopolyphosphatase/guanosine-5'-triphosphate,3'-diphosphate pyrophosphatase